MTDISGMDRRRFLFVLSALGTLPWLVGSTASIAATVRRNGDLRTRLFAAIYGPKYSKNPARFYRDMLSIARVYSRHSAKAPGKALSQFQRVALAPPAQAPTAQDLAALSELMSGESATPVIDPAVWADRLATTEQVIGTVAGAVNPVAGAALGIMALGTGPLLKYLATPGLDLTQNPFPSADIQNSPVLPTIGLLTVKDAMSSDSKLSAAVAQLRTQGSLFIDFSPSDDQLASDAPPGLKAILSKALSSSPNTKAADLDAAVKQTTDTLTAQYTTLGNQLTVLRARIDQSTNTAEQQQAIAQQKQDINDTIQIARSALNVASMLLRALGVSASTINVVSKTAGAAIDIGAAAYMFEVGAIGSMSMIGTFVGAAGTLMSLSGPSFEDQTTAALKWIEEQVAAIKEELDLVENQQLEMLTELSALFDVIAKDAAESRKTLASLQEQLSRIGNDQGVTARQSDANAMEQVLNQVRTELVSTSGGTDTVNSIKSGLSDCYTYACFTSKLAVFGGPPDIQPSKADVTAAISERGRVDLLFGTMPSILTTLGVAYTTALPQTESGPALACPIAWSTGAQAYIQISAAFDGTQMRKIDQVWVPKLWLEGLRIREFAFFATSPDVMKTSVAHYTDVTGIDENNLLNSPTVMGTVYRAAVAFIAQSLTPPYSMTNNPGLWDFGPSGTSYHVGGITKITGRSVTVTNDPYDMALHYGLVKKTQVWSEHVEATGVVRDSARYDVTINVGDDVGKPLLPGGANLDESIIKGRGITRLVNSQDRINGSDIVPFLDACELLIRRYHDYDVATENLPDVIHQALNLQDLESFEFCGATMKLLAALAVWRAVPLTVDARTASAIANASIIATKEDLLFACRKIISAVPIHTSVDWSMAVTDGLRKEFSSSAKRATDSIVGLDNSKSIAIIDDTLSRIGAYMLAKHIEASPVGQT